jgi:hypothetical protein
MPLVGSRHAHRRTIVYPLLFLGGAAGLMFFGCFLLDWLVAHPATGLFATLFNYDVDTLQNALGTSACWASSWWPASTRCGCRSPSARTFCRASR